MKKIALIFSAIALMNASAEAQELKSKKGENYLPEKGDWSIGFNADGIFSYIGNAFNGNTDNDVPSVDFQQLGTFVGKRFTANNRADRYMANLGIKSYSLGDSTATGFNLTAGYGKEWRKGKTRLQGFYGADAMLNISSSSTKLVEGTITTTVSSGLNFGIGARGFIGAEYFIFPKISMGAQYSYGLMIGIVGEETVSVTGLPNTTLNPSGTSFNLGLNDAFSINVNLHF
jgi:hypothetical protein